MPGFSPLGAHPLGAGPPIVEQIDRGRRLVTLTSTAILIPDRPTDEGLLIRSVGAAWIEIARTLGMTLKGMRSTAARPAHTTAQPLLLEIAGSIVRTLSSAV
jgi:hypothetical protein